MNGVADCMHLGSGLCGQLDSLPILNTQTITETTAHFKQVRPVSSHYLSIIQTDRVITNNLTIL